MKNTIKWFDLKITIPYVIGQKKKKKVNSILETLQKNGFRNVTLVMANINAAAITLSPEGKNLLIEPQKICFSCHLNGIFNPVSIQAEYESILNSLLIDDQNQYLISIEGIEETANSHTESKYIFEKNFKDLDEEVYGVGYRFLIKNKRLFGELKIEPYISDYTKYFYHWLLNKSENGTIAEMLHDVQTELQKERTGCYSVIRR